MNFSDILKETQEQAKKDKQERPQREFEQMISEWYTDIKDTCMRIAKAGGKHYNTSLHEFIKTFDDNYCSIDEKTERDKDGDEYITYYLNYKLYHSVDTPKDWKFVRTIFYHWIFEEEENNGVGTHRFYPVAFGLTNKQADWCNKFLEEHFQSDGLNSVKIRISKTFDLYRMENQFVEYTGLERLFSSDTGRYKMVRVKDKEIYNILVTIEW